MGNPRKALAAIMPLPIPVGCDLEVRPMTLAMWAALERIDSPFVTGKAAKDTLELLPSLYLLVHGAAEIFSGDLLAKALAWADGVPVDVLVKIRDACYRQIAAAMDVIPEGGKKKVPTAGSSRSSTISPPPTTGASTKYSSPSRSPHSPS